MGKEGSKQGSSSTTTSTSSSSDAFLEPAAQHHYRFKEPWTVLALDNIQGFLIQLACAGGSGAIAKTAVAPLERVKVRLQRVCFGQGQPVCMPHRSSRRRRNSRRGQQHLGTASTLHASTNSRHNASCAPAALQILLQVQQMSSIPKNQQYRGLFDALRKIPHREGGIQVRQASNHGALASHTP
jgi:hypothetical protein